jgi:phosphoribosylformylglycinamidine (FGAM) synthase-like enzyme
VSGNVSLYNETNGQAIPPTPAIGAVGVIDDIDRMATIAFKAADETIILIGSSDSHIGASLWLRELGGLEAGPPPPVDLAAERANGDMVRGLIAGGLVSACHDVSDGGVLVAIGEMALAGNIGAHINVPVATASPARWLFGEDQGRYLLTSPVPDAVIARAREAGVPVMILGTTTPTTLTVTGERPISIDELRETHEGWLPAYMAGP